MSSVKSVWFKTWFDSPYYKLLYNNRDQEEAASFIDQLINFIALSPSAKIVDFGCGRGRHANYLNSKKYKVTGIDISPTSIEEAKENKDELGLTTRFYVHDFRKPIPYSNFDLGLNLFTSFGYFDTHEENEMALHNMAEVIAEKGVFIMDYLNADHVTKNLVEEETIEREDVKFSIRRWIEDGFIMKEITFNAEGEKQEFREQVRLYKEEDLRSMIEAAGLTVRFVFGDYDLDFYNPENSERLIIIAKKQ